MNDPTPTDRFQFTQPEHPWTVTDHYDDRLICEWRGRRLFDYVYRSHVPPFESPAPYWHPLRTLAGECVTLFRPHDHVWHTGLAMTSAELSGQNFWGGRSYVHDQGYVDLDNNGTQQHIGWEAQRIEPNSVEMVERLHWIARDGARWIDERRTFRVGDVDEAAGCWALDLCFELNNVSGGTLKWGSPTTKGRPNAGYGGLFWRGPRSFSTGRAGSFGSMLADGKENEQIMGERGPWLAYTGSHDESARQSTLVLVDHPDNPRHPTQWFCRTEPFAAISASFMFDQIYEQPADETLTLRYRVLLLDGAWQRDQIDPLAGRDRMA